MSALDVGAGDGYLARELLGALPAGSRVTCIDSNYTKEQVATLNRHAPVGLSFSRECNRGDFDWLLLLDVIEHVPEDVTMLAALAAERLRPGGYAVVSVPAWPELYTNRDVMLGHYRRYRPAELDSVIARSGLTRVDAGALFASLLLPSSIAKLVERLRGVRASPSAAGPAARAVTDIGAWRGGPRLTDTVVWLLNQDVRFARILERAGVRVPGLSAWVVARRTGLAA